MAPSRAAGAAGIGAAGAAVLVLGHATWPVAALGGASAAAFATLRTVRGVWLSFGLLLAASLTAWLSGSPGRVEIPGRVWPWLVALELFGVATIAAVRAVREPVQVSRRLLGAWLASTGAVLLGLSLSHAPTLVIAGALVTFGLMYKLGVVPAYAWAPMLVRHPSPRIMAAGVAAFVLAYAALFNVVPLLAERADAALTIMVLSAATLPWALWNVVRQWRSDRRCASTYAVVALVAVSLLWQARWVME